MKGRTKVKAATRSISIALAALGCFLFANPCAHADTIYVSNYSDATIDQTINSVDSSGHSSVFASGSDLRNPGGLAFDSSGNLYVGNAGTTTIMKYDSSGSGTIFARAALDQPSYFPAGLAFDSSGNLYTANQTAIMKFDSNGNPLSGFALSQISSSDLDPGGLAFDTSGNLYVTFQADNSIYKIDPARHWSKFATTGSDPVGLAFDGNGNLYVADYGSNKIEKFGTNGVGSVFTSVAIPIGLAFDSGGNLYVATGSTIKRFDSSGNGSLFASGLNDPTYLAVQIPEPATWVLLVLAVALLGGRRIIP